MNILIVIVSILYIIGCGLLIGTILMQQKRTAGLGAGMSGMGMSQTYWDKNKGRSFEGKLEKLTKIGGFVFMVATILTWLIK